MDLEDLKVRRISWAMAEADANLGKSLPNFHVVPPKTRTAGISTSGFLFYLRK